MKPQHKNWSFSCSQFSKNIQEQINFKLNSYTSFCIRNTPYMFSHANLLCSYLQDNERKHFVLINKNASGLDKFCSQEVCYKIYLKYQFCKKIEKPSIHKFITLKLKLADIAKLQASVVQQYVPPPTPRTIGYLTKSFSRTTVFQSAYSRAIYAIIAF
ncbi:hypothetical protein BpHYR1_048699 [Brachionus plicatilis]|uniref:Uncharacterized protein n=1 Tax=Brachionus plicatilis TaxID=10195 RepID=A0A3M7S5B3_BRAPC|nr:hypothetical protein BpHYR1_048699 [Brachionus plicatilis]